MTKIAHSTITKAPDVQRRSMWLALGLFGFLLAGQNAFAQWVDVTVPVPQNEILTPLAAIPVGLSRGTLFAVDGGPGMLYEVWNTSGTWYFLPIYGTPTALHAAATYSSYFPGGYSYYVAHQDTDGQVRLSSYSLLLEPIGGPTGWQTQLVDPNGASCLYLGSVAAVMFKGTLYIFYTSFDGHDDTLRVATVDANFHIKKTTLDGNGVLPALACSGMYQPTAVVAPDGLRVYYVDYGNDTLREAYSQDGTNWTIQTIAGQGGIGDIGDKAGFYPSAIVYNNAVNVFYWDWTTHQLRIAQRGAGGAWSFGSVDTVPLVKTAPVVHGTEMEVYYTLGNSLFVARGTGPGTFSGETVDYAMAGLAIGSSNDQLGPYPNVTAVEIDGTGPSVFHNNVDLSNGIQNLRNSYWLCLVRCQ